MDDLKLHALELEVEVNTGSGALVSGSFSRKACKETWTCEEERDQGLEADH